MQGKLGNNAGNVDIDFTIIVIVILIMIVNSNVPQKSKQMDNTDVFIFQNYFPDLSLKQL